MTREHKYRAWDKRQKMMVDPAGHFVEFDGSVWFNDYDSSYNDRLYDQGDNLILMQFTGLHDKNGQEIYELMEINNKYRVIFKGGGYVLQDISTGDIIGLLDNALRKANEREITREYAPVA